MCDAEATIADQKAKLNELSKCTESNASKANLKTKAATKASTVTFGAAHSDLEDTKIKRAEKEKKREREIEIKDAAVRAKHLIDRYGEKLLVQCWLELGGGTLNPPSASKYIIALSKKDSSQRDHGDEKLKDIKAVMYLIDEIMPALSLRHAQAQKEESLKFAEELRQQRKKQLENELRLDWPLYLKQLDETLKIHSAAFMRNMRAAYQKNDYGAVLKDERELEIERFLRSVNLIQRAEKHGLKQTFQYVNRWCADKELEFEKSQAVPENGHDFEHWVAAQLVRAGWTASVTQASGDDGVDVIAVRDSISVAVQCKRYAGSVGNKAVQEVYSGMRHLQLDKAVVISTGKYTKAAQNLASSTGVLLLGEHDIPHMWDLLQR